MVRPLGAILGGSTAAQNAMLEADWWTHVNPNHGAAAKICCVLCDLYL